MLGIEMIIDERMEQLYNHGYTPQTDQKYVNGELLTLAKYFMCDEDDAEKDSLETYLFEDEYGPQMSIDLITHYQNKTHEQRLTVAAALIAAEIDRIKNIEKVEI